MDIIELMDSPMCEIEEIADIFLMSELRNDITIHIMIEYHEIDMIIHLIVINFSVIDLVFFINPTIPSLIITPAKIIEPIVDASTWAFGSQRCIKNMGIFIISMVKKNIIIITSMFFI